MIKVDRVNSLDIYTLHKILTSDKITDYEKIRFVQRNRTQIHQIMEVKLTNPEFFNMMQSRPLIKFRPLKNSYTKWGDKIILSKSLGILPSQLADYIKNVSDALSDINNIKNLPMGQLDSIKTYVYRHGTQKQVVTFLDYELKHSKDILKTIQTTLEYGNGGIADYFSRPIHRMKNQTMLDLYNTLDTNITASKLSEEQKSTIRELALAQIINIQNNSKLIKKK